MIQNDKYFHFKILVNIFHSDWHLWVTGNESHVVVSNQIFISLIIFGRIEFSMISAEQEEYRIKIKYPVVSFYWWAVASLCQRGPWRIWNTHFPPQRYKYHGFVMATFLVVLQVFSHTFSRIPRRRWKFTYFYHG